MGQAARPDTEVLPVFLVLNGVALPPNVWLSFDRAERWVLAEIREIFGLYGYENGEVAVGLAVHMIYPNQNIKFTYHYWGRCRTRKNHVYLEIERGPAMEIGPDNRETGRWLVGTQGEVWSEMVKVVKSHENGKKNLRRSDRTHRRVKGVSA